MILWNGWIIFYEWVRKRMDSSRKILRGESVRIYWLEKNHKKNSLQKQRLIRSFVHMQVRIFSCLCATCSPDQIYIAVIGVADADGVCWSDRSAINVSGVAVWSHRFSSADRFRWARKYFSSRAAIWRCDSGKRRCVYETPFLQKENVRKLSYNRKASRGRLGQRSSNTCFTVQVY